MIQAQTFSRQQYAFLKDNFVVYDPIYQECYTDFSGLETAQVILIGEIHDSPILHKIQHQFLKCIIGDQRACLLAEGLAVGQSIKAKDLSGWHDLSENIWVQGADIRYILTTEEAQKLQNLKVQREELNLKLKEIATIKFENIAKILNKNILLGNFLKIENSILLFNDEAVDAINVLWKLDQEEQEHFKKELDQVTNLYNEAIHDKYDTSCLGLLESNQGLLQELTKASGEFQKILGIWGEGHLMFDDEFTNELQRSGLPHVLLLPNEQRKKDAFEELYWNNYDIMPLLELKIVTENKKCSLEIPMIFKSIFHPALQELFINKTQKPLIFNVKECIKWVTHGISELTFSANQEIVFENIPLNDFHALEELSYVFEGNKELNSVKIELQYILCSVLDNIFMIGGRAVDALKFEGKIIWGTHNSELHKPILTLKSEKPFTLTLKKERKGYASYLLKQMKLLGLKEFTLSPSEQIGFTDIPPDTIDQIIESPGKLFDWLQSKAPLHSKIFSKGEGTVCRYTLNKQDGQTKKGIALQTEKGITIGLL